MTFSVSILATGSELLDGRVVDTNSNFIGRELRERGLLLKRVLCVDDDLQELLVGLRDLSAVSDLIITSGGLGPTTDDLTRDALAAFAGVGLQEHPDARAHLEHWYQSRGRTVDAANLKQALLPVGSQMIPNPMGTAPGFITTVGRCTVCSLSGVPREFKRMFADTVAPIIEERAGVSVDAIARRSFQIFGLPESLVGSTVESLALGDKIVVSYRVMFPEVHVTLKSTAGAAALDAAAHRVRSVFQPVGCVFSEQAEASVVATVHELLLKQGLSLSTAESCTGGMVGECLTTLPGSSAYYLGGVITYANEAKERELSVPRDLLSQYGAVSAEVVSVMAQNARKRFDTDFALSVSGVAGPGGGGEAKPVGTVFIGLASRNEVFVRKVFFANERDMVRRYAAIASLDLLRRKLQGVELLAEYPVMRL